MGVGLLLPPQRHHAPVPQQRGAHVPQQTGHQGQLGQGQAVQEAGHVAEHLVGQPAQRVPSSCSSPPAPPPGPRRGPGGRSPGGSVPWTQVEAAQLLAGMDRTEYQSVLASYHHKQEHRSTFIPCTFSLWKSLSVILLYTIIIFPKPVFREMSVVLHGPSSMLLLQRDEHRVHTALADTKHTYLSNESFHQSAHYL